MSPEGALVEPTGLGRRTARLLTARYVFAILLVAILASAGQVLVQVALSRQAHDAQVINLAGRQRNYSQALCKSLIATLNLPAIEAEIAWAEARDILPRWQKVHAGLITGDPSLDLPVNDSPDLALRWQALHPIFVDLSQRITTAIDSQQLARPSVRDLLSAQRRYLQGMESVVEQLDREARQRVRQTRILEGSLFAILCVVLMAEVLFIFRPVVRRIRIEIDGRERAEEAAIEREVAEVSGRLERRIGQDLHDGLGQVLTGISFQLKALQRRLSVAEIRAEALSEAHRNAADITSQVAQAIGHTRTLARMLHPVEADADSLGTAMRDLGDIAEKVFAVQALVLWDDDLPIPGAQDEDGNDQLVDSQETPPSMHLYRIAQEAMSNAIRHGGAKHLWITGTVSEGRGELIIADDGSGFVPPSPTSLHGPRTGMGLRIMAFRSERIGGRFSLERRPEGGMRVTVTWPILLGNNKRS
jgi:signal transduction histidine kinase